MKRILRGPSGVKQRAQVDELVGSDIKQALEVARKIDDGWYRCQALSHVALNLTAPKDKLLKIAKEAFSAAVETKEPNRIVSVSSWMLWVLAKHPEISDKEILEQVERLLGEIRHEPNPLRRAAALFYLFEAVYTRKNIRRVVFEPLLKDCFEMNSWKAPRLLADIALVLAADDIPLANEVINKLTRPERQEKVRHEIEMDRWLGPHDFLPYYTKPTRDK